MKASLRSRCRVPSVAARDICWVTACERLTLALAQLDVMCHAAHQHFIRCCLRNRYSHILYVRQFLLFAQRRCRSTTFTEIEMTKSHAWQTYCISLDLLGTDAPHSRCNVDFRERSHILYESAVNKNRNEYIFVLQLSLCNAFVGFSSNKNTNICDTQFVFVVARKKDLPARWKKMLRRNEFFDARYTCVGRSLGTNKI